jgi:hypothetical protein
LANIQPAGVIPISSEFVLPTFEMEIDLDIGAWNLVWHLTFDIGHWALGIGHWALGF